MKKNRLFAWMLLFWFVINLLQAIFTEINPDEAYYALYGQHLSWGYFDHPPLVGLITHISSLLFTGNLGVRFITIILQIPTLLLIWKQLDNHDVHNKRSVLYFFIIAQSITMFAVYGFITTPDVTLLFFTTLFLLGYKRFLQSDDYGSVLMMSISMAGLIYSKYQGLLLILLVIISNIKLLLNGKFWLAGVFALLLAVPHFYWQFENGFPSFKYQLVSRAKPFKWKYFLEYLPNQFACLNPFTLGAAVYVLLKYKAVSLYERALYVIVPGFLLFFWASTFRGHAEPQWTIAASIPMIILIHNHIVRDNKLFKYTRTFVAGSLVLIFLARILITTTLLPESLDLAGKKARFVAIEKLAGNRPVLFTGSYESPALYTFFTGKPATVIGTLDSRQTQFDIWHFDKDWIHTPIFIKGFHEGRSKLYKPDNIEINGVYGDSGIQTPTMIHVDFSLNKDTVTTGDTLNIYFTVTNTSPNNLDFTNKEFPFELHAVMMNATTLNDYKVKFAKPLSSINAGEKIQDQLQFVMPALPKAEYKLGLCCSSIFGVTLNSDFYTVSLQ